MASVLIIDDDNKICLFFNKLLKRMGHEFCNAHTLESAKQLSGAHLFDLILLDLELPDGNGIEIIPELMASDSKPEVIIITGTGDARGAEIAFTQGAWDYIQKPFVLNEVSLPITRALQYHEEKQASKKPFTLNRSGIIGESDTIRKCLSEVANASVTDASVLVTGETGTGKELLARAIHENSPRAEKPFVVVDCGALPETLVESTLFGHEKGAFTGANTRQEGLVLQADGGTLMLDEVGELPLSVQKSFLRTFQEHTVRPIGAKKEIPVNFRLVAATNLDLNKQVQKNQFREDLLYRISAIEIKLPPLRERQEDTEDIALKKLHELTRKYDLEPKALSRELLDVFKAYDWPGNVRELINILQYAVASSGEDPTIYPKHLPPKYRIAQLDFSSNDKKDSLKLMGGKAADIETLPTLNEYRDRLEKEYLQMLLNHSNFERDVACRISGVSQSRIYGLLKKHNLPGFKNSP